MAAATARETSDACNLSWPLSLECLLHSGTPVRSAVRGLGYVCDSPEPCLH